MPFAGYKNFQDCVNKNKDKDDPNAYCAFIMRKVEGDDKMVREVTRRRHPRRIGKRRKACRRG